MPSEYWFLDIGEPVLDGTKGDNLKWVEAVDHAVGGEAMPLINVEEI